MKRILAILALVCLLCGCTGQQAETAPTTQTTVPATTEPTTVPTTEATVPPTTEPPMLYTNPLTGLPCEEPVTKRPVAVVTNNSSSAMPQHGTSQAEILVEILSEGGITRNLAIYTDVASVPALGAIRSARTYFQSLSKAFNAILVHSGDSIYANEQFRTGKYPHVDGMFTTIFYRDQARLNAGYLTEHTLFVKGQTLADHIAGLFPMDTDRQDYGLKFDPQFQMTGEPAQNVRIAFFANGKVSQLSYDSQLGSYSLYQHKQDYIDGNTGEKVSFKNVLVLYADMRTVETTHVFHTLLGQNIGYYVCDGKFQPILWNRAAEEQSFTFTYGDGTPVTMAPGTTYIAVVHRNSVVTFE